MNRIILAISLPVLLLLGVLLPNQAEASHAAGAELIYNHVSGNTYVFIFKFYRDCDGIPAPATVQLCGRNTCNSSSISQTLSQIAVLPGGLPNGSTVSPGCDSFPTTCDPPPPPPPPGQPPVVPLPGYEEYWYVDTVTIPNQCNSWTFYCGVNARNNSIVNIAGGTLYTETKFNNSISQVNSSPRLLNKPVPYVCVNSAFSFNHQGFDPDGDSLVYTNLNPLTGPTSCFSTALPQPLAYVSPYTLTAPIATAPGGPYTFNNVNGSIGFVPNTVGMYALAMRVDEYRNGSLIGSIIRDLQIIVVNNCPVINPGTTVIQDSLVGASLVDGYIRGCPNQPLEFCVDIFSPDTGVQFSASSTNDQIIPASTLTYNGIGTDSIEACFDWTPTPADIGSINTFTITATDTSCRPPGIYQSNVFTYTIYIPYPTAASPDTAICSLDSAKIWGKSQLADSLEWTVLSGDFGSLGCVACDTNYVTPAVTTTYLVTDVNSICEKNKDTVVVSVLPPPLVDIGFDDTTICQNSAVQFNPTVSPPGSYTYSWTPSMGLSATNIANPTASPISSLWYYLTVTEANAGCSNVDSVYMDVIPIDMTIDDKTPGMCVGDQHTFTMSGTSPDSFSYTWTPGTFLNDSTIMEPTSSADTTITYRVEVTRPGCMSYVDYAVLTVEPVPVVQFGPDREVCQWDTVHLNPKISPSWFNNYAYQYNIGTNLSNTVIPDPVMVGNTPGTFNYILEVTTPLGCSGSDDIEVIVNPGNFMTVDPEEAVVCTRDSVKLEAMGGDTYEWTPQTFLDDPNSATPVSRPFNSIEYTVVGTSDKGCLDTGKVQISIAPSAVLELGEDFELYEQESAQLSALGNCVVFNYSPTTFLDDHTLSNPTISGLNRTMTYIAKGQTEYGCETQDTIVVNYNPDLVITLPNGYAPKANSEYPDFKIIRRGRFSLDYFRIYNRWGQLIFETDDIEVGWDGTFENTPQPVGTYVYDVQGTNLSTGSPVHLLGDFTLIK